MLIDKDRSSLILIDVQEKLTPFVIESDTLVSRCHWLMRLAKACGVPCLGSEQYPSGLGTTVAPLCTLLSEQNCFNKVHFSAYREKTFVDHWQATRKRQAVLAGIETHVCVLQTAMDMKQAGIEVFVVVDAVSSRHEIDREYALTRMQHQGIQLVTAEMVFFEWVHKAGTSEFKTLSQEFLK